MKNILKIILTLLLICCTNPYPINATYSENTNSPFTEMLQAFYNNCANVDVVREFENGLAIDYANTFYNDTFLLYQNNDFESIFNYIGENNITFIERGYSILFDEDSTLYTNTRGIVAGTYRTNWIYKTITGTGVAGNSISLPITYRITITVNYDIETGKVSGTLKNPSIYISSTDGVAESWNVTVTSCNKSKVNDDYEVSYSNIKFTVNAYNSILWQTYYVTHSGTIRFAPANY